MKYYGAKKMFGNLRIPKLVRLLHLDNCFI